MTIIILVLSFCCFTSSAATQTSNSLSISLRWSSSGSWLRGDEVIQLDYDEDNVQDVLLYYLSGSDIGRFTVFSGKNGTQLYSETISGIADFNIVKDLNNDSLRDILVFYTNGSIITRSSTPGHSLIWNNSFSGSYSWGMFLSIEDITNDGIHEVIATDSGNIVAFNGKNGTEEWRQEVHTAFDDLQPFELIGDINKDNFSEILVYDHDISTEIAYYWVLDALSGDILWNTSGLMGSQSGSSYYFRTQITDTTMDGIMDIFHIGFKGDRSYLCVFNGSDGSELWNWNTTGEFETMYGGKWYVADQMPIIFTCWSILWYFLNGTTGDFIRNETEHFFDTESCFIDTERAGYQQFYTTVDDDVVVYNPTTGEEIDRMTLPAQSIYGNVVFPAFTIEPTSGDLSPTDINGDGDIDIIVMKSSDNNYTKYTIDLDDKQVLATTTLYKGYGRSVWWDLDNDSLLECLDAGSTNVSLWDTTYTPSSVVIQEFPYLLPLALFPIFLIAVFLMKKNH